MSWPYSYSTATVAVVTWCLGKLFYDGMFQQKILDCAYFSKIVHVLEVLVGESHDFLWSPAKGFGRWSETLATPTSTRVQWYYLDFIHTNIPVYIIIVSPLCLTLPAPINILVHTIQYLFNQHPSRFSYFPSFQIFATFFLIWPPWHSVKRRLRMWRALGNIHHPSSLPSSPPWLTMEFVCFGVLSMARICLSWSRLLPTSILAS